MRVPRVYVDMPLESGQTVQLPARQSNYLCKALRMLPGRALWLFNGQGGAFKAELLKADSKRAEAILLDFDSENRESPLHITLGIGLSKGDRFDLVIQKATELGVAAIQPLITERVEVRLNADRMKKKVEHWRGVVVSACEQSGRNLLPKLNNPVNLNDWLGQLNDSNCYVLNPESDNSFASLAGIHKKVTLLVGPEGGLTLGEVGTAETSSFHGISLGPRILRTETVPLAAISIMQAHWGDL